MIDRIIGFLLFIPLSPFFLIVSLIIYIDDGFPVLYRQKRIGINNSIFEVFKFRTMKKNIPDIPTHLVEDPQQFYTRSGPFLRKLSIDEIPQLINIIKGDMVFVGPRPALYNQDDLVELRTRVGIQKLMPGLTGWAQVNGLRGDTSIEDRTRYDLWYVENWSLWLDVKIILRTVFQVLSGRAY